MLSRTLIGLGLALALLPTAPSPARAQAERAVIGGAVGMVGGAVVTLSAIVARARFQREYLDSIDDLVHWQSIPMIAAPAAGVMFGLAGRDVFRASVIGSTSGMLLGAAVGAGIGWAASTTPESPWAGGVIGAGVGLSLGGLLGGFLAWSGHHAPDSDRPDPVRIGFTLPVP